MRKQTLRSHLISLETEINSLRTLVSSAHPGLIKNIFNRRLPLMERKIRKCQMLLNRRSRGRAGVSSGSGIEGVTSSVTVPVTKVLPLRPVDWFRLRSEIKKGRHSYGEIARALGKSTRWRGLVYNAIHGKKISASTLALVSGWAIQNGYERKPAR